MSDAILNKNQELDDFSELFGEDLMPTPTKTSTSTDVIDLFGKDFSFEDSLPVTSSSPKKASKQTVDDELADLFGLSLDEQDSPDATATLIEDISSLLGANFDLEEEKSFKAIQSNDDDPMGDLFGSLSPESSIEISKDTDGFDDLFNLEAEQEDILSSNDLNELFGSQFPSSTKAIDSVEQLDQLLEVAHPPTPPTKPAEEDLDIFSAIDDILAGPDPEPIAPSPVVVNKDTQTRKLVNDLGELFGKEETIPPQETPTQGVLTLLRSPCYHEIEDLESWIDRPAIHSILDPELFDRLATLIDIPAPKPTPVPEVKAVIPEKAPVAVISDSSDKEDEWADMEGMIKQVQSTLPPSARTPVKQPVRSKAQVFDQTMKVSIRQLDTMTNLMGELVVNRNSLEQDQEKLRQLIEKMMNQVQELSDVGARMQDFYERSLLESSLLASRNRHRHGFGGSHTTSHGNDYDPLEMDRFTGFHLLSQEIIELIVRVRESSSDIQFLGESSDQVIRNLRQVTTQLNEGLNRTRMIPFAETADRQLRHVREVSHKLGKNAELHIEGRNTLVDKMIQGELSDPITQIIKNALTHGIEPPEVRQKLGKAPTGRITLSAFLQGNQTVISIADDGAGMNPEVIKKKAIKTGLITPAQAEKLSNTEIYDFIFHPGFSTREQVTDEAGRGVGMDIVSSGVSAIRGTIHIDSIVGKGTTFTIRLPLTLSVCKALRCVSAHSQIAFPMDGVEDMQDYSMNDIRKNAQGQKCVPWRDTLLPFQPLSKLLNYTRPINRGSVYGGKVEEDVLSIVILRSAGQLLALQVDQVIGEQEIVIKQIEGPIPKPTGIAGATVLGDGTIMPIGDVLELIDLAQGRRRISGLSEGWQNFNATTAKAKNEPMVLIVDDSITVRELLSMTFSKSGYRVEQARDGQEAWEKLRSGLPCDLIFCDVEMPRVDGLELLSRIQKDEVIAEIPIAMLTSRGAERHRQVAAELGASGYFTKPYLEEVLLDAAQRMIKGEVLLPNSTRQSRIKPDINDDDIPSDQVTIIKSAPTVLIIDDSVVVRELLSTTFRNAGYQVEQARDGQEAYDKLHAGLPCDVVLCDIEMPRLNGLDLLAKMQEDEKMQMLPVAMLTSRGAQKMKVMASERGAKGYFVKPYVDEVLLNAAKRLIQGEDLLTPELAQAV